VMCRAPPWGYIAIITSTLPTVRNVRVYWLSSVADSVDGTTSVLNLSCAATVFTGNRRAVSSVAHPPSAAITALSHLSHSLVRHPHSPDNHRVTPQQIAPTTTQNGTLNATAIRSPVKPFSLIVHTPFYAGR
jgi:hypothetical protein